MDSEDKFWLAIWKLLGVVALGSFLIIASCVTVEDYRIAELIKSGTDAMDAKCAIRSDSYKCYVHLGARK